jgi:CO dehydrogenase/acetyl-CoA synthase beta subunit
VKIFNDIIKAIDGYKDAKRKPGGYRAFQAEKKPAWPGAGNRDIILMPDLAVEFGSPETASVSFGVWTGDDALVNDEQITLIGPDVTETSKKQNPFGKIVIAGVKGFDETNAFSRNREIYLKKFDLALKGHMLRSASHYMAEWHRISTAAVTAGFSFGHLGSALIRAYKTLAYVASVEVIFVTTADEDVTELYDLGKRSTRIIQAMSKMVNEMTVDCSDCDYQDLCQDAGELRRLRNELAEKKSGVAPAPGAGHGN